MTEPTATAPTSMATTKGLSEAVEALRDARAASVASKGELAIRQQRFAEENADLIAGVKEQAEIVAGHETMVRALALAVYTTTKERKPVTGIEIKIGTMFEIDEVAALAWAKDKKLCLVPESLDLSAMQQIAKVQALPFVTKSDAPKVYIATDLDKALAAEPKVAA